MKKQIILLVTICLKLNAWASYILIAMDESQTNHLKAYGIAYWALQNNQEVDWLLNYRGGSFLIKNQSLIEKECKIRGDSYQILPMSNLLKY